jgi:transposase
LTAGFQGCEGDVRNTRVWTRLLGLGAAVVEDVYFGDEGEVVVAARARAGERDRCGVCRRRSPGFDLGEGRRRWRALDVGMVPAFVEADAPRVRCPDHGVVVCAVPWARHASRFTRSFEEQVCWLAVHTSKSAVAELMRVAWRTVGDVCERVMAEAEHADGGRLNGLRRLGIDEISWRKGQRYLTVVVDHDTGRLVWAAPGANAEVLDGFFALLGSERCARIELISADMGAWIAKAARAACPRAELCLDPFHIVALATEALDEIRREVWNEARRAGQTATARELKGARWALWKNPEALTGRQAAKLAQIQQTNRKLYRAYLLKEQLREIFRLSAADAIALLDRWITWARRCRLAPFVRLAKTLTEHWTGIAAALLYELSNARIEAANTRIRLIARRAFGFHSPEALIALAKLTLGGYCPPLPGR